MGKAIAYDLGRENAKKLTEKWADSYQNGIAAFERSSSIVWKQRVKAGIMPYVFYNSCL